jgi:hypothetical protein
VACSEIGAHLGRGRDRDRGEIRRALQIPIAVVYPRLSWGLSSIAGQATKILNPVPCHIYTRLTMVRVDAQLSDNGEVHF